MKLIQLDSRRDDIMRTFWAARRDAKEASHLMIITLNADGMPSVWVTESPEDKVALMAMHAYRAAEDVIDGCVFEEDSSV